MQCVLQLVVNEDYQQWYWQQEIEIWQVELVGSNCWVCQWSLQVDDGKYCQQGIQ